MCVCGENTTRHRHHQSSLGTTIIEHCSCESPEGPLILAEKPYKGSELPIACLQGSLHALQIQM